MIHVKHSMPENYLLLWYSSIERYRCSRQVSDIESLIWITWNHWKAYCNIKIIRKNIKNSTKAVTFESLCKLLLCQHIPFENYNCFICFLHQIIIICSEYSYGEGTSHSAFSSLSVFPICFPKFWGCWVEWAKILWNYRTKQNFDGLRGMAWLWSHSQEE